MTHSITQSSFDRSRTEDEWKSFLGRWKWDRFVTITFNAAGEGRPINGRSGKEILDQKKILRSWDARMNRRILGREWANMHEFRLYYVYAPEKPDLNPHWHGLVKFFDASEAEHERQGEVFDEWANPTWKQPVPAGDVDTMAIRDQAGALNYLAKSLTHGVNYEHFILPDQFWRG